MALSAEWVSAASSAATLIIVAIGAYAALRQIRHLQLGNQTGALLRMVDEYRSPEVAASLQFVFRELPALMRQAEFRAECSGPALRGEARRAVAFLNFYEELGSLVYAGALEPEAVLSFFEVDTAWNAMAPLIALIRPDQPYSGEWFEYLAVLAEDRYRRRGSVSSYPAGVRRKVLPAVR